MRIRIETSGGHPHWRNFSQRVKTRAVRLSAWWHAFITHPVTPYVLVLVTAFSVGLISLHIQADRNASLVQTQQITTKHLALEDKRQTATLKDLNTITARLHADETTACLIQAQGLPGNRALSSAMTYLHQFFVGLVSDTAHAKVPKKQTATQRRQTAYLLGVAEKLDAQLATFQASVAKQPLTRNCSF